MAKSKYLFCAQSNIPIFSANKVGNGDILCEMRFHVPNNELDLYQQERQQARTAKKASKKGAAAEEEKKNGEDNESS
jgi:hypothetical protein